MLSSLHIENIAVIEKANVEFEHGFNVLTGETGAGKSIVIDSINAVLGERTSKELIRTGCDSASVTAFFSDISDMAVKKCAELGFDIVDNELSIKRTITESKSTVRLNGIKTPASIIKELAPYLINIHGQHDSQALLDPDKHYIYIDLLANNSILLKDYSEAFAKMQHTRRRLKALTENLGANEQRAEILRYEVKELEDAEIKLGEIESLKQRQNEINNSKSIIDSLSYALSAIYSDDADTPSVLSLMDNSMDSVESVSSFSKSAEEIYGNLSEIRDNVDEIKEKLESVINSFDFDNEEIESVEQRLDMYYNFSQKYGKTEEQMLDFLEKAKKELHEIDFSDEEIVNLQKDLKPQVDAVKKLGAELTESRKKAADKFAVDVSKKLEFLDMPKVKIYVNIDSCPYSRLGADKIEFMISTNPGESPKPLAKIASGGEMSRIMLSIKNVLSEVDPVDTLIFDEIDTGISGHAASRVGDRLKDTAKNKQVICVTHLAQIASKADNHLLIKKNIDADRAVTNITTLDLDGRRQEIARIIGTDVTETTLAAADEMLNNKNA